MNSQGPEASAAVATTGVLPIERVTVRLFEAPVTLHVSFGSLQVRRLCLLNVHAGGLVGRGESWINWPSWAYAERIATITEGVAPLLTGEDAFARDRVLDRLVTELLPLGRQWGAPGPIWQAISAVDMALWDLAAQTAQTSLGGLLSEHPRSNVPVYASGIGPNDVSSLVERALAEGFTAAKVKIGFGAERDRAILTEARDASGGGLRLFVDANRAWTLEEAKGMADTLTSFGAEWCEEPLADDDPRALDQLFEATGIPLALGENVYGTDAAHRYMESTGIQHFQPDISKTGGISMGLRFAALAAERKCHITPHSYGSAFTVLSSAQFSAAIEQLGWLELDVRDNPFRTQILDRPLRIVDGHLEVPNGVGLGLAIDEDALSSFEVAV
jgi:D-galactarolactone cycloisomerase